MHCKASHDQEKYKATSLATFWEDFCVCLRLIKISSIRTISWPFILCYYLTTCLYEFHRWYTDKLRWISEWQKCLSTTSDSPPVVINTTKPFILVLGETSHPSVLPTCSVMATLIMWFTRWLWSRTILYHAATILMTSIVCKIEVRLLQ